MDLLLLAPESVKVLGGLRQGETDKQQKTIHQTSGSKPCQPQPPAMHLFFFSLSKSLSNLNSVFILTFI